MAVIARKRRRKGTMTNELIQRYIGKNCQILSGTFGNSVSGKIVSVFENWIEVETKKEKQLLNIDFVTSIKELPTK